MSGHGEKLSRKQEQTIAALLAEPTHEAAAAAVGVGVATLRRWLGTATFAAAWRQARGRVVDEAVGGLVRAAGQATAALVRNLTCGRPAAEIAAAKAIWDGLRGQELEDLAAEVRDLKTKLAEVLSLDDDG